MKYTTALLTALAGLVVAEAPSKLPTIRKADLYWAYCGDLAHLKFDWTSESFSVTASDAYVTFDDDTDLYPDESYLSCPVNLNDIILPVGYRFKFTNVTWSGSATAKTGGLFTGIKTISTFSYKSVANGGLPESSKFSRSAFASEVFYSPDIGATSDFDSTFEFTVPNRGYNGVDEIPWSPCVAPSVEGTITPTSPSYSEFGFSFWLDLTLEKKKDLADASKATASLGKPNGKSDIKITWATVWEKCDPAKFDAQSWGKPL